MPTRRQVSIYPALIVFVVLIASVHSLQAQSASLSNNSRSFGNVALGSSSAAMSLTLKNGSSKAALAITNIAASGDFSQTNTCGASLAARGSCSISLIFTPTAGGTRTGTLTVNDNASPATQTASLSGTGVAPLSLNPTSRAFGSVVVGATSAAKTFTVTNSGAGALTLNGITASAGFIQSNTCGISLAGKASCTINASFAPAAAGAANGTIQVDYNGSGSPAIGFVTGTGVAPVAMSPTSASFGSVVVGVISAAKTFTVTNAGASAMPLTISPSAGFNQTNTCGASLAANTSCTISTTFAPAVTGAASGTVTVGYNGIGSPIVAAVTGTGVTPIALSPASTSFGNVPVGAASAAKAFTVTNSGASAMALAITPSSGFTQTNTCGVSLAAKASCTINAVFTPTAVGAGSGTLTVSYNGFGSPLAATMTGTGVIPVTMTPASTSFGNVAVGSPSAAKAFTVTNSGGSAMAFNIAPSAGFTQTNTCGVSLAAKASCNINVVFTPTSTNPASGTVTVSYNGVGSPLSGSMTGTGILPITVSPTSRSFGNVGVGSISDTTSFTVTNRGTTAMALAVAPSAGFTQTNNCTVSLAAGDSCTINATFTPTVLGTVNGNIAVTYNGFGSPQSVSVTGTGINPITLNPVSRDFGSVAAGTASATKTITVTNNGTAKLTMALAATAGFTETDNCRTLSGGSSCTINAVFSPLAVGNATGSITVAYNGFGSPVAAALTGAGIAPVTITPTSLAFSTTQNVDSATAAQIVTVKNNATKPLIVQSIGATPADYAQTNTCGSVIAAGATCTVSVILTPHVDGSIPGSLIIADSALGSPQTVALSGAGVPVIRSIAVTPATVELPKGKQQQLTAVATYSNNTTKDVTAIATWSSSSVSASVVPTTGLVTGTAEGVATITVSITGSTVTGTSTVTTTPAALTDLILSPTNASVAPGETQAFTATGTYTDGTTAIVPAASLAFSSDNLNVATIAADGVATGVNGGTTNIRATMGSIISPAVVLKIVIPAPQSIAVTPALPSIAKGGTQQFTATGTYADSTTKDVTGLVAWSSNSVNVTINPQGMATAAKVGVATVTATWDGGTPAGSTDMTVTGPVLTSIVISPDSVSVGLGAHQQYTAMGTYSDAVVKDITAESTWSSSDTAVAPVTLTGLANVVATSTTAVGITATLDSITSNTAFLSALSTLPRVCDSPSIDMKVLVVTNTAASYVDLPAIQQILDFVGTPYTVVNYSDVNLGMLSDGVCHGYYQGVIMAFGNDIYSGNANLYPALNSYEQTFHVRQVNWFLNPGTDYGFSAATSSVDASQTHTAYFTTAAAAVFPNINTATPITISNAFIYLSQPYTPPTGTTTPLLTDSQGNVLSAIWAPGNGQEVLSQTFDSNQYLTHNLVLAYGLLNWVTKGVFLGDYHVYAAAQIDDFFINDAEWVPGTSCTNPTTHDRTVSDDPSLPTFRLKAADMTALVAWQNGLQNDPLLKGFKLTMAFNGIGTVGNNDWTGLPSPGVANDDLTLTVQDYEKYFYWVTHTYDHPNTLNGLHKSDTGGDTDDPKVDSIDLEVLTNLFVASGTSQGGVNLDLDLADNPPLGAVTPLNFTDFNPANMVSPGVTGLNDPLVPMYLYQNGIRYVVSDTSVIGQPNNGPNPSPNVGIVNSYAPGIYEVPRYPNNIYYNAANWADDEAEFHCIYGPDPGPAQKPYDTFLAADILNYTSDTFLVNMLKGDMDPQMFHQPNLHAYDGTNSLISDVYNQTFTKYKKVYKLPVLSLTIDQLAEGMKARNAYNLAAPTGTIVDAGTASAQVQITVPPANPGAVVPVTGVPGANAEVYGGAKISHVQVDTGQTVALPLQ